MAGTPHLRNLVQTYRRQHGWSQAELAHRAGVSRAAVSAIETDRLVPSVAAALALARAFGCSVEALYPAAADAPPAWAWPPDRTPCRYWRARVQGRTLLYPAEAPAAGVVPHDGVARDDAPLPGDGDADPERTLVVACCDPAVGLLAAAYSRASGFRLLAVHRTSREALALLGRGLVHAAGVHFATADEPGRNARVVRDALGAGYRLLRVARWQAGLCLAPAARVATVRAARAAGLRWVGREPGSAARQCPDELLPGRPPPRRVARDHRGVAEAVRCGWADAGVCHRLAAEEAGLRFVGVRDEQFDLCYPDGAEGDPRVAALRAVVRSPAYRKLLGELPGYATDQSGEVAG